MTPLIDLVLDLLYPRRCVFCHRFMGAESGLFCSVCRDSLPAPHSGKKRGEFYSKCVSACSYEGIVRESLLRYKFGGCSFYAGVYGPLLAEAVRKELADKYDLITYVPISRQRLKRRGYDQARLLAEALGRELDKPVLRTVNKVRNTSPQSRLSGSAARRANISNAYRAYRPETYMGKRLLLIDDVLTTGATLSEVSRVLLSHGADTVFCGTFAVTPKP